MRTSPGWSTGWGANAAAGVRGRRSEQSGRSRWQRQPRRRPGPSSSPHSGGNRSGCSSTPRERVRALRGDQAGAVTRTGVARPGEPMKHTDSGSCRCRASSWAHHAPYWFGDVARAPQSSWRPAGRERRHLEPAGSWAAAAQEEETAAAAEPWMRWERCGHLVRRLQAAVRLCGCALARKTNLQGLETAAPGWGCGWELMRLGAGAGGGEIRGSCLGVALDSAG